MMNFRSLTLLAVLALTASAQALKVTVWDRDLQTKLGDGESSGTRFNVRLVDDYDGPVVVLFALTAEEKAKNVFPNLKSQYSGVLSGGQLTLQLPSALPSDRSVAAMSNSSQSLARFLAGYKLTLNVQSGGQSLSLPGLKNTESSGK